MAITLKLKKKIYRKIQSQLIAAAGDVAFLVAHELAEELNVGILIIGVALLTAARAWRRRFAHDGKVWAPIPYFFDVDDRLIGWVWKNVRFKITGFYANILKASRANLIFFQRRSIRRRPCRPIFRRRLASDR
jgi:hypothetical protein